MKTRNIWLSTVLATVAYAQILLFSSSLFSDDVEEFIPDHYLSYNIEPISFQSGATSLSKHRVKLDDDFIPLTDFVVKKPIKLLNPALKRHNNEVFPIQNQDLHYTAFQLENESEIHVEKPVLVINQFGTFVLEEFRPSRILAPSRKKDLTPLNLGIDAIINQPEIIADHYLCYDIPRFDIETAGGLLIDQFRRRPFEDLVARRFCNPVVKIHHDKKFDIVNDVEWNHLMCFEVEKRRIFRIVALFNQFGFEKAIVTRDEEICVPSFKVKIPGECSDSSPDDEGICNGLCRDPNEECVSDSTGLCRCQPIGPVPCSATVPDGNGMCNGLCPNSAEECVQDTTGICICQPSGPLPCSAAIPNDEGVCNGTCPAGEFCIVNDDQNCQCLPAATPCGFTTTGECGGACPRETNCTLIPDANFCGCVFG